MVGTQTRRKLLYGLPKLTRKTLMVSPRSFAVNEMTGVCLSVQQACFTTAASKLGYLAVLSMVLLQILARRWLWVGGCGCVRRELQSCGDRTVVQSASSSSSVCSAVVATRI